MNDLFNFRNVAHLPTRNQQKLRAGIVYRTGNITHISQETANQLRHELNIGTYVDFRTTDEIKQFGRPDALIEAGILWRNLEIDTKDADFESELRPKVNDWVKLYHRIFERNIENWVKFLRTFLEVDHAVIYGCLFGKDRTGVATSFLLTTLDVMDEHIQKDFSLTTENMFSKYSERFSIFWQDSPLTRDERIQYFSTAHPEIIAKFGEIIRREDESFQKLLVSAGFTEQLQTQLREKLLVD